MTLRVVTRSRIQNCSNGPTTMLNATAGSSVQPHLRCLRLVGFCRKPPNSIRAADGKALLGRSYHVFVLLFNLAYVAQQLIYAYQQRDDMEKLSEVLFLMLCHVTCIAKQVAFHTDAARIELLIAGLDDASLNGGVGWQRALRARAGAAAGRLLRLYAGCAAATCALWTLFPAVNKLRGRHVQLPFYTAFEYNHPIMFAAALAYSYCATTLVGVGNTTMDAFVATLMHQCQTQFRILRINFETLSQRARSSAADSGIKFDIIQRRLFVECLIHYRKITETNALLQSIFSIPLLVQFAVGGWILCMAAYRIVGLSVVSLEFVSTMLFLACILAELFLYCFYGNELTVESELLVRSMFCAGWVSMAPPLRRALALAMTRAQRPLRPAAGRVVPLTLHTFLQILKSSYSFYTVLRQTKE